MLMRVLVYLFSVLFFTSSVAQEHKRCVSVERLNRMISQDPSLLVRRQAMEEEIKKHSEALMQGEALRMAHGATIIIPVVVHVVYNKPEENISDLQVRSQIEVLNQDYNRLNPDSIKTPFPFRSLAGRMNVQFRLATVDPDGNGTSGITRYNTTTAQFTDNDKVKHFSSDGKGGTNAWDTKKYLNLWVCNMGSNLLGYAQFPGTGNEDEDGVVINYRFFGNIGNVVYPYDKGRTATHEIGHWLNLYHIWGDDGQACSGSDNVNDTPNQTKETYSCPSFPQYDSCTSAGNGIMFMNFLDYTDDACMNMFSKGQVTRMISVMNIEPRTNILVDGSKLTGINEAFSPKRNLVRVFPNPSRGKLLIENTTHEKLNIKVYSMLGNLVLERVLDTDYEGPEIDLREQPDGVYIVELKARTFVQINKLILSR
jgi:hypothetical protein